MLEQSIEQLENEILSWMEEVWPQDYDEDGHWTIYRMPFGIQLWRSHEHPLRPALVESIRRLQECWPSHQLSLMVAEMYFNPRLWILHYRSMNDKAHWQQWIISTILDTLLKSSPPSSIPQYVERRLTYILSHPFGNDDDKRTVSWSTDPSMEHFEPRESGCLRILLELPPSSDTLDLIEKIVLGNLDIQIDAALLDWSSPLVFVSAYYPYRLWISGLMQRLYEQDRLDYKLFAEAVRRSPYVLEELTQCLRSGDFTYWSGTGEYGGRHRFSYSEEFMTTIAEFVEHLLDDVLSKANETAYSTLKNVRNLSGPRWLLTAAALHRDFHLKKLVLCGSGSYPDYLYRKGIDSVVIHLAQSPDMEPSLEDERARLIAELRTFPTQTLKYLLPVTPHGRGILLEALDWRAAESLIDILMQIAAQGYRRSGHYYEAKDVPNSDDPESGMVDIHEVRKAVSEAGEELAHEVCELFRAARIGVEHTVMLVEAVAGWNRVEVEKGFQKRNQRAVKAYGLLPLQRGLDEAVERYTALKQFAKESRKFGPERQTNERAAVQSAMSNLAQVAGYQDVMRLEWDMEARLSSEVAPVGRTWEISDYQVELLFANLDAQIEVTRDGKLLKTPPPAVRQNAEYATIKETVKQLREQVRRFKATFEEYMTLATPLSRADLVNLNRMPAAQAVLSRLILQTMEGVLGLYNPEEVAIITLAGERHAVTDTVIIAHAYHLFTQGQIEGWQREIVRRRIVQPFKQAFRELYVLTPAEQETGWFSNRFAGHVVEGKVAARLLQTRQWQIAGGEPAIPSKIFREHGFEARFTFPDVGHYFSELPFATSDQIVFLPYPHKKAETRSDPESIYLPLADIPPCIFSEVMRDADLVVSVAQRDGEGIMSHEVFQRRGELVTALLNELGLPGVTIDGHHARVVGKLASYRVHLGSATIHIEPGSYLCVVPDRWGKTHRDLFLPFADAGDDKISEVISKVLLLINDSKIKDQSILRQIRR